MQLTVRVFGTIHCLQTKKTLEKANEPNLNKMKYIEEIPYELIAELCTKISVDQWIKTYENSFKR